MLVGEGLIGGLLVVSAAELCWVDAGWAHCALLYCCCAITRSLRWRGHEAAAATTTTTSPVPTQASEQHHRQ